MEDTNYSAGLGDLCEKTVINFWSGKLGIEDDVQTYITNLRNQIVMLIKPTYSHGLEKVQDMNFAIASVLRKEWGKYEELLTVLDYSLTTDLHSNMIDLISNSPLNKDRFRYLFQASMVLAGELAYPTFSFDPGKFSRDGHVALPIPGQMIPNVTYSIYDTYAGQFDALLLPKGSTSNGDKFNFINYLESRQPWAVVEIKTPFRPGRIRRVWKRSQPYGQDLDQFNHRLGELISYWEEKHNHSQDRIQYDDPRYSIFPLPEAVLFCYLRGVLPTTTIRVDTKGLDYLRNWQRRVDYAICPIDQMAREDELPDAEYKKREAEIGSHTGEIKFLNFPLWALVETAQKKMWESMNGANKSVIDNGSLVGGMVTFDGQLVPEKDTRTKNKKEHTKYPKPKKKDQIKLL